MLCILSSRQLMTDMIPWLSLPLCLKLSFTELNYMNRHFSLGSMLSFCVTYLWRCTYQHISHRTGVLFVQLNLFFTPIVSLMLSILKSEQVAIKLTISQVHISRKSWEHVLPNSAPRDLCHRCSYLVLNHFKPNVEEGIYSGSQNHPNVLLFWIDWLGVKIWHNPGF